MRAVAASSKSQELNEIQLSEAEQVRVRCFFWPKLMLSSLQMKCLWSTQLQQVEQILKQQAFECYPDSMDFISSLKLRIHLLSTFDAIEGADDAVLEVSSQNGGVPLSEFRQVAFESQESLLTLDFSLDGGNIGAADSSMLFVGTKVSLNGNEPLIHPPQVDVALRLFQSALVALERNPRQIVEDFAGGVRYLILVPTFNSLMHQTMNRLEFFGLNPKRVAQYQARGTHKRKWELFMSSVEQHPKKLHILICDECHWGQTTEGVQKQWVNSNKMEKANVLILQVSATPYNVLSSSSRVPLRFFKKNATFSMQNPCESVVELSHLEAPHGISLRGDQRIPRAELNLEQEVHVVDWFASSVFDASGLTAAQQDIPRRYHRIEALLRQMSEDQPRFSLDQNLENILPSGSSTPEDKNIRMDFLFVDLLLAFAFSLIDSVICLSERIDLFQVVAKDLLSLHNQYSTPYNALVKSPSGIWHCEGKTWNALRSDPRHTRSLSMMLSMTRPLSDKNASPSLKVIRIQVGRDMMRTDVRPLFLRARGLVVKASGQNIQKTIALLFSTSNLKLKDSAEPSLKNIKQAAKNRCARAIAAEYGDRPTQRQLNRAAVEAESRYRLAFEDLVGISGILFLVAQGKMGDTLPKQFDTLDLRSIPSKSISSLASLEQHLGRVCRYVETFNKIPEVLLSAPLHNLLHSNNIVNTEQKFSRLWNLPAKSFDARLSSVKPQTLLSKNYPQPFRLVDPKNNACDYGNEQVSSNRIVLRAEPQIGKTAAFLQFLCLFKSLFVIVEQEDYLDDDPTEPSENEDTLLVPYPYWQNVCTTKWPSYSRLQFDKYHPHALKRREELVRRLIGAGKPDNLVDRIVAAIQQEELVLSKAGLALLRSSAVNAKQDPSRIVEVFRNWDGRLTNSTPSTLKQASQPIAESSLEDMFCANLKGPSVNSVLCAQTSAYLSQPTVASQSYEFAAIKREHLNLPLGFVTRSPYVRFSIPNSFLATSTNLPLVSRCSPGTVTLASPLPHGFLKYWIFSPSFSRTTQQNAALLNYESCFGDLQPAQVVVVRQSQFDTYCAHWGRTHIVMALPDHIRFDGRDFYPTDGVGYSRLWIQLISFHFQLPFVWILDDNVSYTCRAELAKSGSRGLSSSVRRCPISDVMVHLEAMTFPSTPMPPFPDVSQFGWTRAPPGRFKTQKGVANTAAIGEPIKILSHLTGSIENYAILGIARHTERVFRQKVAQRCEKRYSPFLRTPSTYSFILLNVKETVRRGVFYPPKPFWEDVEFAHLCEEANLICVKFYNFSHSKAHVQLSGRNKLLWKWNNGTQLFPAPPSSGGGFFNAGIESDAFVSRLKRLCRLPDGNHFAWQYVASSNTNDPLLAFPSILGAAGVDPSAASSSSSASSYSSTPLQPAGSIVAVQLACSPTPPTLQDILKLGTRFVLLIRGVACHPLWTCTSAIRSSILASSPQTVTIDRLRVYSSMPPRNGIVACPIRAQPPASRSNDLVVVIFQLRSRLHKPSAYNYRTSSGIIPAANSVVKVTTPESPEGEKYAVICKNAGSKESPQVLLYPLQRNSSPISKNVKELVVVAEGKGKRFKLPPGRGWYYNCGCRINPQDRVRYKGEEWTAKNATKRPKLLRDDGATGTPMLSKLVKLPIDHECPGHGRQVKKKLSF